MPKKEIKESRNFMLHELEKWREGERKEILQFILFRYELLQSFADMEMSWATRSVRVHPTCREIFVRKSKFVPLY